jgi:tight adherence protein C
MILVLLIGILLAGVAVGLAVRVLASGRIRHRELLAQVGSYGFTVASPPNARERSQLQEALQRLATWAGRWFEDRLNEERRQKIRLALNSAGFFRTSVTRYLGYRVFSAVGVPLVFLLLFSLAGSVGGQAVVFLFLLAGFGYVAPPFYLRRRARIRIEKIDYEMPELVDLLVTTVEAGVGFVAALQLSARRVREPLGQELRVALREQAMGLTLEEALRNLGNRSSSPNLRAFVGAILQGETLGVSIGKILRDLAVDMRKRRRQMAEERAQKAPIKLLFPLVFLILPAMFIVLLGPPLYDVATQLGG